MAVASAGGGHASGIQHSGASAALGAGRAIPVGRAVVLLALFDVALHIAYFSIPDVFMRETLHYWGLVRPCTAVLQWLWPASGVVAEVGSLVGPGVRLVILRGCDGAGLMFLLVSAVLAAMVAMRRWSLCPWGLLSALLFSYGLNLVRLLALYALAARMPAWFDVSHDLVIPLIVVFASGACFMAWVHRLSSVPNGASAGLAGAAGSDRH